jgi:hypothetical protein
LLSPLLVLAGQALGYYEAESELDDFYAGGTLPDARGLKHFPRLWYGISTSKCLPVNWSVVRCDSVTRCAYANCCFICDRRAVGHSCRCKDGEYSTLGQLFFTPLIQQVPTPLARPLSDLPALHLHAMRKCARKKEQAALLLQQWLHINQM